MSAGADESQNPKHAGFIGNPHLTLRVTPFHETPAQAREAARLRGYAEAFTAPTANWQEHQRWNRARVGNYAQMPVEE